MEEAVVLEVDKPTSGNGDSKSFSWYDMSSNSDEKYKFCIEVFELNKPKFNTLESMNNFLEGLPTTEDISSIVDKFSTETLANTASLVLDAGKWLLSDSTILGNIEKNAEYILTATEEIVSEADEGMFKGALDKFIILDIPNSLYDYFYHMYSTDEFSVLETMMRKAPSMLAMKMLTPGIASKAEQLTDFSIKLAKRTGYDINTNIITVYNNTSVRDFNFVVDIIPKNAKHSNEILKAIMYLKLRMAGNRKSEFYLEQSYVFTINFFNEKINDYLTLRYKDKESGKDIGGIELNLTRLNVDMGVDGNMQLFEDGTPKHIQLTLTFQERRPLRRESNKEHIVSSTKKINKEKDINIFQGRDTYKGGRGGDISAKTTDKALSKIGNGKRR